MAAFEQEYAEFVGVRSLRRRRQRHRRPRDGAAGRRSRPRRRGGRAGQHLHRHRRGGRARGRHARSSSTSTTTPSSSTPPRSRRRSPTARAAVIPVDLYGQVAPFELLPASLAERGIAVVEDGAQSQGATRHGQAAGTFGSVGGHELLPRQEPRRLRRRRRGAHRRRRARADTCGSWVRTAARPSTCTATFGFNSRLDTLQAVVLRAKLQRLAAVERRSAGRPPPATTTCWRGPRASGSRRPCPGNEHVWHLYVVRVPARDDVLRVLQAEGVGAGVHYPVPVHLTPAMARLGHRRGSLPGERAGRRRDPLAADLPGDHGLAQQERVAEVLSRRSHGCAADRGRGRTGGPGP